MYLKKVPHFIKELFPSAIWTSEGWPALKWTFDDGPHPDSTPYLLGLLEDHGVQATFFCQGENAERYPLLINQILEAGHQIGNHGYLHMSGWKMSTSSYLDNLVSSSPFIETDLYRPPYGRLRYSQYRAINKLGIKVVLWDRMPGDFDKNVSKEDLLQNLITNTTNSSITVLHDQPKYLSKVMYALSKYFQHQS